MSDMAERLNAALEGRYVIERELGECGMASICAEADPVGQLGAPLGPHYRREFGLQDLQRDLTLVLQVVGQVDRGHATLAELAFDGVAAF